ncbi:MAG: respiratory nitrate reductase subunit gamma [Longimicrobiales bacterium]|nr:respiratory nitrate reductase subunit gamma [Longimicrobiales bacterium]
MDVLRFLIGGVLPYVAVPVFLIAMVYRIRSWMKLPAPSMTLFPAPAPDGKANAINAAKEAVFFRSLFKGDRSLWALAWGFHVVLALIFVGHVRVVSNVDRAFMSMGMTEAGIQGMSSGVGGAAGVIILVTALVLLVRRLVLPRVKEITGVSDVLALMLIGAILITGNMMRFGAEHFDLTLTREYFATLASFGRAADESALQNGVFLTHMGLAFLLLMYIPFSKILHFGGIFFTHPLIRKH